LPDRKIQEIVYAARPELRLGSGRWSVVAADSSRRSITIRVVEGDAAERDEGKDVRVTWHRIRWGRSMSQ
jgi:hypothetical protein